MDYSKLLRNLVYTFGAFVTVYGVKTAFLEISKFSFLYYCFYFVRKVKKTIYLYIHIIFFFFIIIFY